VAAKSDMARNRDSSARRGRPLSDASTHMIRVGVVRSNTRGVAEARASLSVGRRGVGPTCSGGLRLASAAAADPTAISQPSVASTPARDGPRRTRPPLR
jgi:hypothetical protein